MLGGMRLMAFDPAGARRGRGSSFRSGVGPSVEEAARLAVDFAVARTGLDREEVNVLLSSAGVCG